MQIVVNSWFDVLSKNKRCVVSCTTHAGTKMLLVIIGAAEVGSISLNKGLRATLEKGEELGHFAYGGSTVLTLFMSGTVRFDDDLRQRSLTGVETLVKMGSSLGSFCSKPSTSA